MKGLKLCPGSGFDPNYFRVEGDLELMTNTPGQNLNELSASFGTLDFLLKQTIFPVVLWKTGETVMRMVGTASCISCTGYLLTAAHVLMAPYDEGFATEINNGRMIIGDDIEFGVIIPTNPAIYGKGLRIFPFEKMWIWGDNRESPLLHERDEFKYSTDIAICKIAGMPDGAAHQPLQMSLNSFSVGELAYSIGYAEMSDIPINYANGELVISDFEMDLYVSIGKVGQVLAENHINKTVRTPGPCFDFAAKIPGKMSGAPIFGAQGAIIRGTVSGSLTGEHHAYGAMLGAILDRPLDEPGIQGRTIRAMLKTGNEGIADVYGQGL